MLFSRFGTAFLAEQLILYARTLPLSTSFSSFLKKNLNTPKSLKTNGKAPLKALIIPQKTCGVLLFFRTKNRPRRAQHPGPWGGS